MAEECVDSSGFHTALVFYVNGKKHVVKKPQPETTLLEYLRAQGLTGTKLVCGEGGCGACTVMVQSYDPATKKICNRALNACISPLCSVDSMHVITVEGIGSRRDGIHPVQERIAKANGSQCGFCTPGIVMSMYTLLRNNPNPTARDVEENFDGNLCRCTGYRPILDAAKSFSSSCCGGGGCGNNASKTTGTSQETASKKQRICPGTGKPCACGDFKQAESLPSFEVDYDPAKELIFPPELMRRTPPPLRIHGDKCHYYRPLSLQGVLDLKRAHPDLKFIIGSSEIAIEMKFRKLVYPKVVNSSLVPELNVLQTDGDSMIIGGSVTLARLEETCKTLLETRAKHETQVVEAILEQLRWFAGKQIRNVASVGGNICTASPISDLNPVWLAAGAVATLVNVDGVTREVPMSKFFVGYRKTAMESNEVLQFIRVPFTRKNEYVEAYKQARRRDDDIAIVTACFQVLLEGSPAGPVVKECRMSFGGMAPTTVMAPKAAAAMVGKPWNDETFRAARELMAEDLPLSDDAPGAMIAFRRSLTTSFFFKFTVVSTSRFVADNPGALGVTAPGPELSSVTERFHRPLTSGTQDYEFAPKDQIGHPETHLAAALQATGEAQYVDDMPKLAGELHSAFLLSKKAHAKILKVDASEALKMPGVVGFVTASDVPGTNKIGPIIPDEEVFYSEVVPHVAAPMGLLVAQTHAQAVAAVESIVVEYEDLPPILTIEQAIREKSFLDPKPHVIKDGDAAATLADKNKCPHTLEGEVRMGGQEHFYLEPNAHIVVPGENDEITAYVSTQNPTKTQGLVAACLGIPSSRVVCKVKRMGGGFGGKETRTCNYTCAAAVAARKFGVPVRIVMDREVDMSITGQRHSFLGKFKVGFTDEGRLTALHLRLYNNAGCSTDLSQSVMDRALFHCDNNYHVPDFYAEGWLCKMNIASNTAFRGFGGPQGMMMIETVIDRVARTLGKTPEAIRELNQYTEGQCTPYGQKLDHCMGPRVWKELKEASEIDARRLRIAEFNKANRWKKRGFAAIPTKFGISFTAFFMNQAGALVNIYVDGTVLVTHAGTEMGQGLHTKMAQVAAAELGISVSKVYIAETATDKVPNTSPTAASVGSDLNGMAVLNACKELKGRLEPYLKAGKSFDDAVKAAYFDRVSLSATGFYKTPDIWFDMEKGKGRPFGYFTYGAALSEVEVDCLTGDFQILESRIVMDLGKCINPTIDVGQIEGAFVQGVGLTTLEELVWTPRGEQFTRGPSTYKIPSFSDIPVKFDIKILRDAPNPYAVHSSKAVGEPPLFLGSSVFFAIKEAVAAARADVGLTGDFNIDSPATCERIRMACADEFTEQFTKTAGKSGKKPALIFGSFEPEGFR